MLLSLKTASVVSYLRRRMPERIGSKRWLYRKSGLAAIVVLTFFAGSVLEMWAQMPELKRPSEENQEKPPEPKPKKKVKGPRAVGLVQFANGKSTLIPVAILVDGKFYDASIYKADPVPMALESGTVYEVEQDGDSQGLFTVNGALHSKTAGSPHPWVGAGAYLPNGSEVAKATRKAEDVPVGINDSGDEPPRLTRGTISKPDAPAAKPSSTTPTGSPSDTSSGTSSGSSSGTSSGTSGTNGNAPAATQSGNTSSGTSSSQQSQKPGTTAPSGKPADPSA